MDAKNDAPKCPNALLCERCQYVRAYRFYRLIRPLLSPAQRSFAGEQWQAIVRDTLMPCDVTPQPWEKSA